MEKKYDTKKLKEFVDDAWYMFGDYAVNYDYAVYNEMGNEESVGIILEALFKLGKNQDDFLAHPENYKKEISIFNGKLEDFLL